MSGQTALILGATGATGKHLLRELLASSKFSKVGEFGRRTTPLDGLPNKEKLAQKVIDFEKVHEAGLNDEKWDVVYIVMGTTRAQAGSMANFRKIDQDYVVDAAKAARRPEHKQRLVYLSVAGSSLSSHVPYYRSKAETEIRLASLEYDDSIVCRPGLIFTQREQSRFLESLAMPIFRLASYFSDNAGISVEQLARAVRLTGELGSSDLQIKAQATQLGEGNAKFTVVPNPGLIALANL